MTAYPSHDGQSANAQTVAGAENALPGTAHEADEQSGQRKLVLWAAIGAIVLLLLLAGGLYALLLPSTDTARVRDIFIILMALESLIIGTSLIILLFQLARLINLLQNEIKPILESTQNTVNNLRGTTAFLSDNMVEPVLKLGEYVASLRSVVDFVRFTRRK